MRARAQLRRPGLAVRFAGASLLVFLAVGIAAHIVVRQQVQSEDQRSAQSNAVFVTDSVIASIFQGVDLSAPLSESSAIALRARLEPVLGTRIKRIKLWRSDGTIIYSDEPLLIGRHFDASDDFAATRRGPHSEVTDLTNPENTFERGIARTLFSTYLRLPDRPQLMLELYQDYAPTQAAIDHTVFQLDLALVSALLLLFVLVLPIAARATRTLRASNDALRRSNEDLRAGEERLRESLERERAALERLRSLDEMKDMILTSVSHELRTPLTSIVGFASTLQQRQPELSAELQREIAERIKEQSDRLQRLLGGLLDVDRLQRGILETRPELTDIGVLVRRVVELSEIRAHTVEVSADHLKARVDPSKVERILENLLSNAVRHTPRGTRIAVRASRIAEGILLEVEDDGPGIPRESREQIFQPLVHGIQRAPHAPGAGVGLALVAGFAELHGGRAWVEESATGGALFKVVISAEQPDDEYFAAS